MERYSNSTREVAQDGRRGALMLTVSGRHPDAEAFIDAKMEQGKVTGANVSVRIDDEFMQCAESGKPYVQRFPVDSLNPIMERRLTPRRCGQRLCITHGKAPSRGYSSGTPFVVSRCPTVTLTSGLKPFPPIRAAKYLFVLTTAAVCWPSTCSAMSKALHHGGKFRLRAAAQACRQGSAHDGRHHRPGDGED